MLKELFSLKKRKERPGIGGLLKSVFFLAIGVMCVFALSYAWFNNNKNGNVEDIEFVSVEAVGFEASLDGVEFHDNLEIDFPDNLVLSPVSGDGLATLNRDGTPECTMYYPILPIGSNNADEATGWVSTSYDETSDENKFYMLHIYFKGDVAGYVILSDVSVQPLASPEHRQSANYYADDPENPVEVLSPVERPVESTLTQSIDSSKPVITKDYMAAATRVGITNLGTASPGTATHLIVIPNSSFKLVTNTITNVRNGPTELSLTMLENYVPESKLFYFYHDGEKQSYTSMRYACLYSEEISADPPYLLRLQKEDDNTYRGEINVCLWVEGYDDEAIDLFADGRITMSLTFNYIEKEPEIKN